MCQDLALLLSLLFSSLLFSRLDSVADTRVLMKLSSISTSFSERQWLLQLLPLLLLFMTAKHVRH